MSADATTPHARDAGAEAALELRCGTCGSREPVRTPSRVHGWQRCRHCASVIVAPWSDWEAHDGPHARTVLLERRGRAHFVVPRRTLLTGWELAAWLFIANTITAFCIAFFEIPPTPDGVWRWLGPLAVALAGLIVSALFVRLWATVQHLEISPQRMRCYRTLGTGRYALREHALAGGLEIEAGEGLETVSENRFRVRLRAGREKPVDLVVPTRREALWLAALVRRAVEGAADGPRCGGCGAPLRVSPGDHAGGGAECDFCGAGFVVGVRDVTWPAVPIPWPPELGLPPGPQHAAAERGAWERAAPSHARPPEGMVVRRSRGPRGDAVEWQLPPEPLSWRLAAALGLVPAALFFAGFGAACLWILEATPAGAIGLPLYILSAAAMMFGIAGFAAAVAALQLFGRQTIAIDEASLRVSHRLGRFDLGWLPAVPAHRDRGLAPARWQAPKCAVPLLRLTDVVLARDGAWTDLRLATPVRALQARWRLPAEADRWLRRALAGALAERLGALGRDVGLGPSG